MTKELKVDYKSFEVRDPSALLDYAVKFYDEMKNALGGQVDSISYTCGNKNEGSGMAAHGTNTITIGPIENGEESYKTAAVLYIIAKSCCKRSSIHYFSSNKNNTIDTKHTKKGRSKTQEYLDNLI